VEYSGTGVVLDAVIPENGRKWGRMLHFYTGLNTPVACDVAVISARPVLDSDRGAGLWIPDKPCGLSGMTTGGYIAADCGVVHC
jgi:hypothetical protein